MADKERIIELGEEEMWTPFHEEVNGLFHDEKKSRHENDANTSTDILKRIIQLCYDNKDLKRMNQFIIKLAKFRGQAKKAISEMIKVSMTYFDKMPDRQSKADLVDTLRTATAGKLFVEGEYAKCTRVYSEMMEEDGKIQDAADALLEVQVETYGSLTKEEKLDYILYQLRVVLDLKDYVRTLIILKKIQPRQFTDASVANYKVQYHNLSVQYNIHQKEYLATAKSYQTIYDTILADKDDAHKFTEGQRSDSFSNFVTFLLISPYSHETVDLFNKLNTVYRRELERFPILDHYVTKLLLTELMPLNDDKTKEDLKEFSAFQSSTEHHATHVSRVSKMIIQHNLRVAQTYYSRIRLERLSVLIGVGVDRCEKEIADMVYNKAITAKINRIEGIVTFKKKEKVNEALNVWNADVNSLLKKVEETCHLINRERVVYSK